MLRDRKRHARAGWALGLGLLLTLSLSGLAPVKAEAGRTKGWVLVCNAESGLQGLTRRAASRLFLRRSAMVVGGRQVEPLNLRPMSERLAFLSALTRLTPTLVERHFMDLKFRGEGDWPSMAESPQQALEKVRADPALIGWVPIEVAEGLESEALDGLRLLKLDGKDPSAADYALLSK